ncbi:nSTAND3 domain-containing NTPase [Paenibacillus chitinolyticus]
MSKLTDIKQKILQFDGGGFQELCDAYLYKLGYENVTSLGTKSGTLKTTKGIPDTYFLDSNDKYIFVMYTTQQKEVPKKLEEDVFDCLNFQKTGIEVSDISEIILCHTSSNIPAGKTNNLYEICSSKGVLLKILGIDELASDIYNRFHGIARDFLGVPISTEQIFDLREFVMAYDSNGMAAPLSTTFQMRKQETVDVLEKIEQNRVTILTGPAGVGKTRLALECCEKYAEENKYRLFCIQSNRLPIYEDLKIFLNKPDNYLLFIDDGNQISGLNHVLQYLTKAKQGYEIKIVITVRDYAKYNIVQETRNFTIPEICEIGVFKDEEIKELIKENLKILNTNYLDKIVRISEGNARLAVLAGKLAVDKQRLDSINDATELYENYYGNVISRHILSENKELCAVAGILAFISAIHLDHLKGLVSLLESLGISESSFIKYVYELHELEIVDIYHDKAAKISDQCFGNYLLNYVFVQKKIVPLAVMIKACFVSYRHRVVNAVNTLANIFASNEMHQQLEKEIGIVWDDFQKSEEAYFLEYVKIFHSIRPTETLLLVKEKIDSLPYEAYDVNSINFDEEKRRGKSEDNFILRILGGFCDTTDLPDALDLMFDYYKRQPKNFVSVYQAICNTFVVKKDSHRYGYWTQNQLITKFVEHSDIWRNEAVNILFLKIAAEFLKLVSSPTEAGRGNSFTFYKIPIELSEGSEQYRGLIWNGLLELYQRDNYQLEIEKIIAGYGSGQGRKIDHDVVKYDFKYIKQFFEERFSPDKLSHCLIAKKVSEHFTFFTEIQSECFSLFINSPDYKFYSILKGKRQLEELDYHKERELKKADIHVLFDNFSKATIHKMLDICLIFNQEDSEGNWGLQDGVQCAFNVLSQNKEAFLYAIDMYLMNNTPLDIVPDPIVAKMLDICGDKETYSIINQRKYAKKADWQFSFFKNLPQQLFTEQYLQDFYKFLSSKEIFQNVTTTKELDFLQYNPDVYMTTLRLINQMYEYSPSVFSLYVEPLFNIYKTQPEELLSRFKSDLNLLKDLYFNLISCRENVDSRGKFLFNFNSFDSSFLEDYIQYIMNKDEDMWAHEKDEDRLSRIWKWDNYIHLADQIMETYYLNREASIRSMARHITNALIYPDQAELVEKRQDEWITHFVDENHQKVHVMLIIYSAIAELPFERRKKHVLYLIRLNQNYELFDKLQLVPSIVGGWGNMIADMEKRISFLESLLPSLTGITYLRHKQKIERHIEMWKREIEREQVEEVFERL